MSPPNMKYRIDPGRGLVLVEYLGSAGFEEWASILERVLAEPDYRPGFGFLVDRRRAEAVTTADLHRMVAFIGQRRDRFEGGHWAIVVSSLTDYGMARMGQVWSDDHPTTLQVFSDRDDGIRWLVESGTKEAG